MNITVYYACNSYFNVNLKYFFKCKYEYNKSLKFKFLAIYGIIVSTPHTLKSIYKMAQTAD